MLITKLFEWYVTGEYSLKPLTAGEHGPGANRRVVPHEDAHPQRRERSLTLPEAFTPPLADAALPTGRVIVHTRPAARARVRLRRGVLTSLPPKCLYPFPEDR